MSRYAVFGNPISHSQSPAIHRQFAKQTGVTLSYDRQQIDVGKFHSAAEIFFSEGGAGLNVTVPFKLDAFEYAEELSDRAAQAGAVNTLIFNNGVIKGDNTDGEGLLRDLKHNLQWPIEQKNILLLGAGGAVRGVLGALLSASPASLIIANRTEAKAQELVLRFEQAAEKAKCKMVACGLEQLSTPFDLVINGTSASLGGELPPIATSVVVDSLCYDMMYGKDPTAFLSWAKSSAARDTADGLGMLVEQAAESFYLWCGVRPNTAPVIQFVRNSL